LTPTATGLDPAANGEPFTAFNAPVEASTEKAETFPLE
jgi:hypothetical protein